MGPLIVQLVPVVIGVILSPLAIMALVAVLLSPSRRANGLTYLLGWVAGIVVVLGVSLFLFTVLDVHPRGVIPLWATLTRLVFGLIFTTAAVWVYRREAKHIRAVAAATTPRQIADAVPTLPGWLQKVETFSPSRCFFLGLGLFVLNPVDASCAIVAGLDITLAGLNPPATITVTLGFAVLAAAPIAAPVFWVLLAGDRAASGLDRIRTWIAGNTHVLNAALLLVIGVLQLEKAITTLI